MAMEIIVSVILLFVGIGVLIIIHICVVGRAFQGDFRPDSESGRVPPAATNRAPAAMDPESVKSLPWFDHNGSSAECAVCLEIFRTGERCRILPLCGHCFHTDCIDSWLMKTGACPVCRSSVRFGQDDQPDDAGSSLELV